MGVALGRHWFGHGDGTGGHWDWHRDGTGVGMGMALG